MEITGTIVQVLPEKSGTSTRGLWRKQEYILETDGDYPKKICFMVWGDRIDEFAIRPGQRLTVAIDLESREYNGRWYTDVKAWKVTPCTDEPGFVPSDADLPPFVRDDLPF